MQPNSDYEAGYNAFMLRTVHYCLAHADASGGDHWEAYGAAVKDNRPETLEYFQGWEEAQSRMTRETQLADLTPRRLTSLTAGGRS